MNQSTSGAGVSPKFDRGKEISQDTGAQLVGVALDESLSPTT
jgi:hypothetical protein